jgi:hypothetical protein
MTGALVKRLRAAGVALTLSSAVALGFSALSCGLDDFDPVSKLDSVRILATRADKPYAKPGEQVHLELLAIDARKKKPRPMEIYWIPLVCQNPLNDAYYACFAQALRDAGADGAARIDAGARLDGGTDAAGGGLPFPIGQIGAGTDITNFLPKGPTYSFTMPADIIKTHPEVPGATAPYGVAIVFNLACAGRVQLTGIDASRGPQQIPLGCVDEDGARLGPEDYVIGYTRVYAYDTRTNQNPKIAELRLDGKPVDPNAGMEVDTCKTSLRRDCPKLKVATIVDDAEQELDPEDRDPDGTLRKEQIWVSYYSTTGQIGDSARLLYDPKRGKIENNETDFQAAGAPEDGLFFAVVHDNRGGTSWIQVPLRTR